LPGVVVAKVQDPAFGLVEPHPIGFSPATQPVGILTSLPRLMSYANFLIQHCVISSRSLIKMMNGTGPDMDLSVTALQGDYNPLTIILYV